VRLVDRSPRLDAGALAERFAPPRRFHDVRFDTYIPDASHPSQAQARARCESFAVAKPPAKGGWFRRKPQAASSKAGLYLDGGFGVGKTHLLASTWHAFSGTKAYLTFTELTAFIGFAGMQPAVDTFEKYGLVCIDEFELDDVANTLMVVTFLRGFLQGTQRVAVTSNTLPDRLGEERFSASEFRREIKAIASVFDDFRVDGPDFRTSHKPLPLATHVLRESPATSHDSFPELLEHLRHVHPVQYGAFFDEVDAVIIDDLHPLTSQDDALRVVQFLDKLYDTRIPVRISGCNVADLFDASFRNGGYRKKYGRAESRLTAMQQESAGLLES
jgi:cell division protein ZapE